VPAMPPLPCSLVDIRPPLTSSLTITRFISGLWLLDTLALEIPSLKFVTSPYNVSFRKTNIADAHNDISFGPCYKKEPAGI